MDDSTTRNRFARDRDEREPVRGCEIAIEDPRAPDVRVVLESHLDFARANTPPDEIYALDLTGLLADSVTFFCLRERGKPLGVGALRRIDATHVEIKSMHTLPAARGRGVARAMLEHLLDHARACGYRRVSLETGSKAAFEAARTLYASAGFVECEPFADYESSPISTCMSLELDA